MRDWWFGLGIKALPTSVIRLLTLPLSSTEEERKPFRVVSARWVDLSNRFADSTKPNRRLHLPATFVELVALHNRVDILARSGKIDVSAK